MWISIDIETYEKYKGTKESAFSIVNDSLIYGSPKEIEKQKEEMMEKLKKDYYYPVLNSRKFVLGCIVTDKGEKKVFYNDKEMWNWIVNKIEKNAKHGEKTFVFGHNIEYDLYGLIRDRVFDLISTNLGIVSDEPFLASWKINKKNWGFFVDSYSFYRNMSVEDIGLMIGYQKLIMPKEIKKVEEIADYCMRDVEIVLKAMGFLKDKLKELGFSPKKFLTAGQVAMSTFLSFIRKNNEHWNIMRSGEVYKGVHLEKCRPAYRGARNEAFKIGEREKGTYVDINSLYPYAMTKIPFPKLNEEMYIENPLEKNLDLKEILDRKFIGVVECEIEVPEDLKLGYLPVRFRGKLYFPEGKRVLKGTWTTLEIRRALSLGYKLIKIEWVCLYPVAENNVFEKYINKLYDIRKKSQKDMGFAIKLIMNNLYGKFAQFRTNKEIRVIYRDELTKYKKDNWKVKSVWGNKYIIEKYNDVYKPKYTNLMISILITAFGRDYLYQYLSKIKMDDLIYCDTDGIILKNLNDYRKLFKFSEELGDWKVVGDKEDQDVFVKSEKDYKIGDEVKISGVSKKALKKINFEKTNLLIQKRRVGIKDVLIDPEENFMKFGSFRDYEINLKTGGKRGLMLPETIDERKEWVNVFE